MNKRKRLLTLFLILAMTLSLTGCGGPKIDPNQVPESTGGKDVQRAVGLDKVFSLNSNPRYSFNPMVATNRANQLICDLVYENMVEIDNNFEVIPNVITDWMCNDDGNSKSRGGRWKPFRSSVAFCVAVVAPPPVLSLLL